MPQDLLTQIIVATQREQQRQDGTAPVVLPLTGYYLVRGASSTELGKTLRCLQRERARGPGLQGCLLGGRKITLN